MKETKVDVDTAALGELISKLSNNNEEICKIIGEINTKFIDLDEIKWKSPERKKYDDQFIPFLNKKATIIKDSLEKSNKDLNTAKENYVRME